jgi:hypothetical protein
MELLNRYLQAVKAFLPLAQQNDIIEELSENILSKVEDKEADLGRELTECEQESLLKQYGHPFLMALQYRPQRQLIGPLVFPVYWFVINAVLAVMIVFAILIPAVGVVSSGKPFSQVLQLILDFPAAAMPVFGWLTAEFAFLDYCIRRFHLLEKWNAKWNPRSLPKVVTVGQPSTQCESISALVLGIVFIGWWLAVPSFPYLMFGPGEAYLTFGPGWHQFQIAILLLSLTGIARQLVELLYPEADRLLLAMRLARDSAGLVLFWFVFKADSFILFVDKAGSTGGQSLAAVINQALYYSLLLGLVISGVIQLFVWAYDVKRRLRNSPRPAHKKA